MTDPKPQPDSNRRWRRLPAGIWVLGFVSMLMDISSEMIHALLPIYLTVGLGATALTVGVIEGIAEATASIVKIFSGALSDRIGRRKELAALGYGLAALSKPVFPLAGSIGWVVAARFIDRVGKGIRGAPRDALIADLTPEGLRGAAFGLRQSLDTIGAFIGPLAAIALMAAFAGDFVSVFWVAVIPAFLALGLILTAVREPARSTDATPRNPLSRAELSALPAAYWVVIAVASAFMLARFSEAFLILRAVEAGLAPALAPLVLVGMNLVYAASAYPVGALSDRIGRRALLVGGARAPDRRGSSAGVGAGALGRGGGRADLGASHGDDAGPLVGADRGRRTGGPARHGLRSLPSGHRRGASGRQRDRGRTLAGDRIGRDLPCRGGFRGTGAGRRSLAGWRARDRG
ncbi:MFS transporter [Albidovulum sediminicola]|uniref:MFS transporter n=1 Tax=Albidovulum sediminicola TaxID=2984331 RepID=A0ABT2YX67_9RHOB|nr:MFS transporter [Defluviimonas sp. WL0075]MCV2863468.1 MFS transporter [Defluviimonas sp. WL0075]